MTPFSFDLYSSVLDIPKELWEEIWPFPHESYNFYLCQEKANIQGFNFRYLVIKSNDSIALIAPLFIMNFNFEVIMEGLPKKFILFTQKWIWSKFLIYKMLFCGSAVGEKGVIGIRKEFYGNADLMRFFDSALLNISKQNKVWIILIKDFSEDELDRLSSLKSLNYFISDSFPTAVIKTHFSNLDEFLATISYGMRKDMRRKMREVEKLGGLEVEIVNQVDHIIDEIYTLYNNVYNASPTHFEHLTKDFFLNFSKYLPNETRFFLYRINGKLAAFNFCLEREDALIDKYIGLDYSISRKYNLYHFSFLYNMKWCIENKKKFYSLSQGAQKIKKSFGAQIIPLRGLVKIASPLLSGIVAFFGRFFEPKKGEYKI